jgi:hypothetical protein
MAGRSRFSIIDEPLHARRERLARRSMSETGEALY